MRPGDADADRAPSPLDTERYLTGMCLLLRSLFLWEIARKDREFGKRNAAMCLLSSSLLV